MIRNDLRNVAIIAHVDHGKTTLVDAMLRQSGAFRDNQVVAERVMDSGDIERERGITILAKNCSCTYKGVKINIVDTPGHARLWRRSGAGAEKWSTRVVLLVDAAEGCMPQTRFVLHEGPAAEPEPGGGHQQDRPPRRPHQRSSGRGAVPADGSGRLGRAAGVPPWSTAAAGPARQPGPRRPRHRPGAPVRHHPGHHRAPEGDPDAPFQMLVSSIDYNDFVGRIGIGRIRTAPAAWARKWWSATGTTRSVRMKGRLTQTV